MSKKSAEKTNPVTETTEPKPRVDAQGRPYLRYKCVAKAYGHRYLIVEARNPAEAEVIARRKTLGDWRGEAMQLGEVESVFDMDAPPNSPALRPDDLNDFDLFWPYCDFSREPLLTLKEAIAAVRHDVRVAELKLPSWRFPIEPQPYRQGEGMILWVEAHKTFWEYENNHFEEACTVCGSVVDADALYCSDACQAEFTGAVAQREEADAHVSSETNVRAD